MTPDIADLIGAPFLAGARGPAYDCYGLVCEVRRRMGRPLPVYAYPPELVRSPEEIGRFIALAIARDPRWHACAPTAGAVVTIRQAPGIANHCGIVVEPGVFLHTLRNVGAHLSRLDLMPWRQQIAGVYSWDA